MKKKILSHALCAVLVILCCALMPMLLFFNNIGVVKFYEIAAFIGIYSFIGLFVFIILKFIFKSEYKAAVTAGLFSLIFQNTGRLTSIMSYKIVACIFIAIIAALFLAAWKFLKEQVAKIFVPVFAGVLAMLIILNTLLSIGKIVSVANVNSEIKNDINKQYEYLASYKDSDKTPDELANIYFIIVDEYAGFNSIEKHFNYDNKEFKTFLENNNFTISETSTNYLDGTMECLANVFNLEFNEKNRYTKTSEAYCQKKMENGALFRLAEDNGYTVNVAQTTQLVNYDSQTDIYGDKWSATGNSKSTIDLMISPSMLVPFTDRIRSVLNGVSLDYFVGRTHAVKQAQSYSDPLVYFAQSENVGKTNTFNLCYASIPHQPFFFDENGNVTNDVSKLNDWSNKDNYLNQFKYCTTLLQDTISNIVENDPNSIIILMSDHGARNHSNESSAFDWMNEMTAKDNTDILCAVYYKGESFTDIEGMCGSNVMISVVNEAFGYNIPLIAQSDSMYYKTP